MKKTLLIFLMAAICLPYIASAAGSANIIESSLALSGRQGQSVAGTINVNNTGNTALNLAFTGTTLAKGTDTISIGPISSISSLQNGSASVSRSISFTISGSQTTGTYSGTINITNQSNGFRFDSMPITVNVTPSLSLSAAPSSITRTNAIRNRTYSDVITLTNNGNGNFTSIIPSSNAPAANNVSFNRTAFSLTQGSSTKIKVTYFIPHDEAASNHKVGDIMMAQGSFSQTVSSINVASSGKLGINDFDVHITYYDGDTDTFNDAADGSTLEFEDHVKPGSSLEFQIDAESLFTDDDEDPDIEDIIATVTIPEIDDGEDIEEESPEFTISPGDEERIFITADIPLEVRDGSYDILLSIEGNDEDGVDHVIEMELHMKVVKERRDIIITKKGLFPASVSCNRNAQLNVQVMNIGTKDEDDVKVEIINKDLGINFAEEDIEVDAVPFDDDSKYDKELDIAVPKDAVPGNYPIRINAYLSGGEILYTIDTAALSRSLKLKRKGRKHKPGRSLKLPMEKST